MDHEFKKTPYGDAFFLIPIDNRIPEFITIGYA